MNRKEAYELLRRYLALVLLGLFKLKIFYSVFTPLTVYPVFFVVQLFDNTAVLMQNNIISFSDLQAQIIPACVAGAAYYLLLILNLTTPMETKKRVKSILFLLLVFLFLNITRILVFAFLLVWGYQYFELTHILIWYFGSTIMVVLIWFANVFIFKINNIPVYTDMMNIYNNIIKRKKN